jgi:uncharacterized YigZ family protein
MSTPYKRPAEKHRTEIVVINSRFITTIARADTPDAARTFIQSIRTEMTDASHHVYAFRAGYGNSVIEGMSDDGEPAGTSGPPTLAVVRGSDIGDIVLVTTRYFGGTKLGTGGLVRAYTESAQTALASLKTEMKATKVQIGMDIPYTYFEQVKRLIAQYEASTDDETFAGDVSLIVTLLEGDFAPFKVELTNLTAGQVEPILLERLDN